MAKLRDQMMARARDTKAGAQDLTCRSLAAFSCRLGGMRPVQEMLPSGKLGPVIRTVHTLTGSITMAGMLAPFETTVDVEAGEHWGVSGEIDQALAPALREFLNQAKAAWVAHAKDKQQEDLVLHPPGITLQKPPNPGRQEHARRVNAERARARAEAEEASSNAEAAPQPAGGEVKNG